MATIPQLRKLYFPAWNRAFRTQWTSDHGRILPRPGRTGASLRNPDNTWTDLLSLVESRAESIARAQHRALSADDLRHACHILALGRDKSSRALNNAELDRCVTLFHLLADDSDLDSIMLWLHPETSARKRDIWFLEHCCIQSYIAAICRTQFSVPDYHLLPDDKLHDLVRTMKNRPAGRIPKKPHPVPAPSRPPDPSIPF